MGKAIVQKEERRTGARVFILSGAVGDDPLVFIESHACWIDFEFIQWNGDRARNVTCCKALRAAHIHDNRFAAVEGSFGILH